MSLNNKQSQVDVINPKGLVRERPSSQGLELKHRTPEQSEKVLRLELKGEKELRGEELDEKDAKVRLVCIPGTLGTLERFQQGEGHDWVCI